MHEFTFMTLDQQVRALGSVPFSHGSLLPLLHEYKRPNDKITRWLTDGHLVQLRRGLYVLGKEWRTSPLSLPAGRYPVQALIACAYPALSSDWKCEVVARDFATMRPMFLTEPPSFDALLTELGTAENVINER